MKAGQSITNLLKDILIKEDFTKFSTKPYFEFDKIKIDFFNEIN